MGHWVNWRYHSGVLSYQFMKYEMSVLEVLHSRARCHLVFESCCVISKYLKSLISKETLKKSCFNFIVSTAAADVLVQVNAFITRSDLSLYYTWHCDDSSRSSVRFNLTTDTPHLTLTGELWGIYYEDFGENWPRYNGTALYQKNIMATIIVSASGLVALAVPGYILV